MLQLAELTIEERLAARFDEDDVAEYIQVACPPPELIAWELRRRDADLDELGWDSLSMAVAAHGAPQECYRLFNPDRDQAYCKVDGLECGFQFDDLIYDPEAYVQKLWDAADRPRLPTDIILFDAILAAMRKHGRDWIVPENAVQVVSRLTMLAEGRCERRRDLELEKLNAEITREESDANRETAAYEAWLASGAPSSDELAAHHRTRLRNVITSEYRLIQNRFRTAHASLLTDPSAPDADYDAVMLGREIEESHWSAKHSQFLPQLFVEDGIYPPNASIAEMTRLDAVFSARRKVDGVPLPANHSAASASFPMLSGTQTIVDDGTPIVAEFNAAHATAALSNVTLPLDVHAGPLREPLNRAIAGMIALSDLQRAALKFDTVAPVLGVLAAVHEPSLHRVVERMRTSGSVLPDGRVKQAARAFEAQVLRHTRSGNGWRMNSKGDAPDPQNADNVSVLLSMVRVEARYNTWIDRAELRWGQAEWVPLTDAEMNRLRAIASRDEYRFRPAKDFFRDMLQDHAREHRFDPVLDRIDGAVWDGQPRLATWLTEVCGVPSDPYHQAVSKNVIGGIVKRARHPGCRHDEMMILISPEQGVGKSTICRILALEDSWHSDSFKFDGSPQNMIPQLFGKLVVECGELAGWSRKDAEDIKQFITSRTDNFTRKYEAFATDQPRRCIFVGTTNSETPLKDETGNRRFLPVHVASEVNIDWLKSNIWQLVAEAAQLESAGTDFSIPKAVWKEAARHQEAARDVPQHEELLQEWLGEARLAACGSHHIRSMDIGRAFTMAGLNSNLIRTIGATMRGLGYQKGARIREEGQRGNRWVKQVGSASPDKTRIEPEQTFPGKPVTWRIMPVR